MINQTPTPPEGRNKVPENGFHAPSLHSSCFQVLVEIHISPSLIAARIPRQMNFTAGKEGGINHCAVPKAERKNTKHPPAQLGANFSSSTRITGRRWRTSGSMAHLAVPKGKTECHVLSRCRLVELREASN